MNKRFSPKQWKIEKKRVKRAKAKAWKTKKCIIPCEDCGIFKCDKHD
tara:strand:+ start:416 stop:556 length:141 start_codon:yes stop_codon:yes gene_type:complete